MSYLPATRVDIGYVHEGASGSCRYVRRASNGDLYVTGPSLKRTMFRSSDGGRSWSAVSYDAGRTWEPGEYVLGEGENYSGCIATVSDRRTQAL